MQFGVAVGHPQLMIWWLWLVKYSWCFNGYNCRGEDTPILYASREGLYTCEVFNLKPKETFSCSFNVQSEKFYFRIPFPSLCYLFSFAGRDGVVSVKKLERPVPDGKTLPESEGFIATLQQ